MKFPVNRAILLVMQRGPTPGFVKPRARPGNFPARTGFLALRVTAVLTIIAVITFLCSRLIRVNATTVGFAYLVAILVIATWWGFPEALVGSVAAMLCFNFFFLPPIGTFNIADPQNWVALFAFLATSIIASQLSARARREAKEAVDREKEMERLYALSRSILLTDTRQSPAKQITHQIAQIFEFPALALYDHHTGEVYRSGSKDSAVADEEMRQAAFQENLLQNEGSRTIVAPIRLGGQPVGSLAVGGSVVSDTALQALSNLVGIGLERVRGQEAANRAEAARQSDELKSTLLDAIAHEFKTPLTSIKAAATGLLSTPAAMPENQRELVTIVDEEADRLGRLVSEAIQMARIEAGKIQLNRKLQSVDELIETALQHVKPMTEGRKITVNIAKDLPMIRADAELMTLAIRQLLDNAVKYSPPASPLTIGAEKCDGGVTISVEDAGPGIAEQEQSRVFDKFYRSPGSRQHVTGTGMGLAIARQILHAHGGEVLLASRPGHGSIFSISVPAPGPEKNE